MAVLAAFGDALEKVSNDGRTIGRVSELPYEWETISNAIRVELLRELIEGPDRPICEHLGSALIHLENFLPDFEAELLIEEQHLLDVTETLDPGSRAKLLALVQEASRVHEEIQQRIEKVLKEVQELKRRAGLVRDRLDTH